MLIVVRLKPYQVMATSIPVGPALATCPPTSSCLTSLIHEQIVDSVYGMYRWCTSQIIRVSVLRCAYGFKLRD